MKKHYEKIILYSDRKIEEIMNQQVMDQSSEFYGGFRDHDGLVEPKLAIFQVTTMTACLFNSQSRFYGSEIVYDRITIALSYIVRGQRENGFFDLINCNFYSGADTAFCLDGLLPAYIYLDRLSQEEDCSAAEKSMLSALLPVMKSILVKGGKAMIHGGFHTPNHRWAIASVLMMLYRLTADESMKQGAEKFLIEGCDCNDDGEYAERSAGGYNLVNNNAMMMLAAATGDDSWYEPVKRNLAMMLHYIEPDGSIFTNNSTRQDRGNKIYPTGYYLEYLYMGIKFHNETFLQAACFIMDQAAEKGIGPLDWLIHFMLHPELREFEYDNGKILKDYCHHYTDSGIVRLRRESYSCSLLKDSPSFLYFQHGDLCVSMKIGASFCEHRYFVPENLVQLPENEGFVLNQKMAGWYYLPFKEPQDTTDWWQMDHTKREKLNGPDMNFVITATEVKDGMDITIETAGIDRAPVRIELAFDAGCRVESPYFISEGNAGGGIVAKEGIVTASKGKYAITTGPGFGTHNYVAGKFGSQGRSQDCYTVYFTDFTCFKHTISLRAVPSAY
ncbi:hypothetical protein RZO55_19880 [Clostridium boliviensis]|uniref:Heparinase II/III-like protein n=1 Tax=Clostridium boliviensis TaxID=318465 RepID=A0ABU4GQC3_9CLOT|nr:hypothetical protein [Clostridium boliviensis]MDW2799833.1 hypothetical protein [Clostridium boliviensis]